MTSSKAIGMIVSLSLGVVLFEGVLAVKTAKARWASLQTQTAAVPKVPPGDSFHGEEIYYVKCNVCHTAIAKLAPSLQDVYKRNLASGQPGNDQTVTEKLMKGGPYMPSYQHTLGEKDLADLLSYLREGKCCPDPENPPSNPLYRAPASSQRVLLKDAAGLNLRGGPKGLVRSSKGDLLEGMIVQLISQETSIRTTVYSNEEGRYEFPRLPAGSYTLRIARPLEFKPYQRDHLRIDGAAPMPDIVLERITETEFLPPTPEIADQLTGAEYLMNISGTGQDKKAFSNGCSCHVYNQVFRNRYDERSWGVIVNRMLRLTIPLAHRDLSDRRGSKEDIDRLVKWLATARGPGAKDAPFRVLPRPSGAATRAIITEYELPRLRLFPHDVAGDANGNIWFTSHRTAIVGVLDPRTGVVKEQRIPSTPGVAPGTHWVAVDPKGMVWMSQNWAHQILKFDPQTETFKVVQLPHHEVPLNSPNAGNMALAPDGSIWEERAGAITKMNPETGEYLARYPLKKFPGTYENMISKDGNFWCGGGSPHDYVACLDIRTGEVLELHTPSPRANPARGGFDPEGNAWFGGRGGTVQGGLLIKFDAKTRRLREYTPPTPTTFYEAMPDKNGEVWAGELQGGRIARFNPRTERWIEYLTPEPMVYDRRNWIDNSTDPVSVWYVDHYGRMVHIQPLE